MVLITPTAPPRRSSSTAVDSIDDAGCCDLFRFDFAFPLDGPAAGALRFIGGFESAF